MGRRKRGALTLAGLGALGLLLWRSEHPRGASPDEGTGNEPALAPSAAPLDAAPPSVALPPREVLPRAAVGSAPLAPPAERPITVRVLRADDRSPIPGVEVSLRRDPHTLRATTDEAGMCVLDLAPTDWGVGSLVTARVEFDQETEFFHAIEDACTLYDGTVPLQEELELLACSCALLRGEVVDGEGNPITLRSVTAYEPGQGARYIELFYGRQNGPLSGRFSFAVSACRAQPLVRLDLELSQGLCTRYATWEELTSERGARIEVLQFELVVRTLDERGRALAGARVRAGPLESSSIPREQVTDERGESHWTLPAGAIGVCAGLDRHASAERQFELSASKGLELVLELRTLAPGESVRGLVRLADGTPVDQALVTATLPIGDSELRGAGMVQVRAGPDGRFELAWSADSRLSLVAYARGRGLSREHILEAGEREVELVIQAQGELEVQLEPPPGVVGFSSEGVEYVLIERGSGWFGGDSDRRVPFTIEELLAGDYDLWVFARGWQGFGQAFAHVADGEPTVVRVPMLVARSARGVLRRADGSPAVGVRLRPLVPGWPDALAEVWTARVAVDGSFELVLGSASATRVLPLEDARTHEPFSIAAGDGQGFVLR